MGAVRTALAAVVAAGIAFLPQTARAAGGEVYISNQAPGRELVLTLEPGTEARGGIGVTFLDSLDAGKKATVVQLAGAGDRQVVKPGETAVLSQLVGNGPSCRLLRLAEPEGPASVTLHYRVKPVEGGASGRLDFASGKDGRDGFEQIDPDIVAFWGT